MNTLFVSEQESTAKAVDSGLVLLSTTPTELNAFYRNAEKKQLFDSLGAFEVDSHKTYLARLRKNVGVSARIFEESNSKGFRKDNVIMVTLTYSGTNEDWTPKHVKRFTDCVYQWCKRSGFSCRYVWVAELQKRGVIHYHVAIWLPRGVRFPKPDLRGWWAHGMTQRCYARHAVAYLMKYLSKDASKTFGCFPKGARKYGVGGLKEKSVIRRWLNYPSFIKGRADINERWVRAVGGGWTSPDGEIFESEYQYCYVAGVASLVPVCRHERFIDAWGAFSWFKRMH